MRFLAHQVVLNPAFYCLLLLLVLAWKFRKEQPLAAVFLVLCMGFLFAPPIKYLVEKLEHTYPAWEKEKSKADFILVLGAGGSPDLRLSITQQLGRPAYLRVIQGVKIANHLPNATLVMSSAGRPGYPSQAEMYAQAAMEWGIETSRLGLLNTPKNTAEEAESFALAYPNADTVIVVTTAMHLKRAVALVESHGFTVIPAASDFRVIRHPDGDRFPWMPSVEALQLWKDYLHEQAGWLIYQLGK